MTDLPPLQYLDEAARAFGFQGWHGVGPNCPEPCDEKGIIAHARALHELVQARAEIAALKPRETLEQVARREAESAGYVWRSAVGCVFNEGFLRAAEMAKKGELPDE